MRSLASPHLPRGVVDLVLLHEAERLGAVRLDGLEDGQIPQRERLVRGGGEIAPPLQVRVEPQEAEVGAARGRVVGEALEQLLVAVHGRLALGEPLAASAPSYRLGGAVSPSGASLVSLSKISAASLYFSWSSRPRPCSNCCSSSRSEKGETTIGATSTGGVGVAAAAGTTGPGGGAAAQPVRSARESVATARTTGVGGRASRMARIA